MAAITTTSRGAARVESRPHAGTVVIQVGDALVSLSPFEARKVAEYLVECAGQIDQRASIDHSNPQAAAA